MYIIVTACEVLFCSDLKCHAVEVGGVKGVAEATLGGSVRWSLFLRDSFACPLHMVSRPRWQDSIFRCLGAP